tara:strand:+ start:85057 stop:85389 length:333 start_codon:yes stop_codon:yes gene_type:complete
MTAQKLFELSEISDDSNFKEIDYAVPMNPDHTYPHNGQAIMVYYKEGQGKIVPYRTLAEKAMGNVIQDQKALLLLLATSAKGTQIKNLAWQAADKNNEIKELYEFLTSCE